MRFLSHIPQFPLSQFVENFWWCSDAPAHALERIVPSATIELVINLREDEVRIHRPQWPERCERYPGAAVSGTYAGPFFIDPRQHGSMLGVHFKPGGALNLLGDPRELANCHVALEDLWGVGEAGRLRERLCEASGPAEYFQLLERALLDRLRDSSRSSAYVSAGMELFQRSRFTQGVREVAARVGLSQRRFIQVFTQHVGVTPKLYCRILRFQRVKSLAQRCGCDWAQCAAACGYFDQSHLIRDFREFSGLNPSDYLRQRSDSVLHNHVPVATRSIFSNQSVC
jgi:AraC-like DNA-binding protein